MAGSDQRVKTGFGCYTKDLEVYPLGTGEPLLVFEDSCDMIWPESWGLLSGDSVEDELKRLRWGAETSSEVLQVQPRDKEQTDLNKNVTNSLSTSYVSRTFCTFPP